MLSGYGCRRKEHRLGVRNEKWEQQVRAVRRWLVPSLGILFVFSAAAKMLDLRSFALVIGKYVILPGDWAIVASIAIPAAEFLSGMLLLLKSHVRTTLLGLMIMVAGFTVISSVKSPKGPSLDCGCFGSLLERRVDIYLLLENLAILVGLFISWITWKDQPTKRGGET